MQTARMTIKKRNTLSTWFILIVSVLFFVPSVFIDKIWINMESIEVQDISKYPGNISMEVDRNIIRNFMGTYAVTIRNADTDQFICIATPPAPFEYRSTSELPEHLTVSWWLGGMNHLNRCRLEGFTTGNFYMISCHSVVSPILNLPIAGRCVESNVFTVVNYRETQ